MYRVSAMKWMIMPYQRYFDFNGRSQRMEYWMFMLFYVLVCIIFGFFLIVGLVGANLETSQMPGPAFWVGFAGLMLFLLCSLIPSIAVTVRRFHDQNLSGWMYLLGFIPYVGGIVVWVFMCLDGTQGDNRFGMDPKGRGLEGVFA
jgi:uncharacterized membrane protein YhaH (DUF805 family)